MFIVFLGFLIAGGVVIGTNLDSDKAPSAVLYEEPQAEAAPVNIEQLVENCYSRLPRSPANAQERVEAVREFYRCQRHGYASSPLIVGHPDRDLLELRLTQRERIDTDVARGMLSNEEGRMLRAEVENRLIALEQQRRTGRLPPIR